jgi:hypothetical protein
MNLQSKVNGFQKPNVILFAQDEATKFILKLYMCWASFIETIMRFAEWLGFKFLHKMSSPTR